MKEIPSDVNVYSMEAIKTGKTKHQKSVMDTVKVKKMINKNSLNLGKIIPTKAEGYTIPKFKFSDRKCLK